MCRIHIRPGTLVDRVSPSILDIGDIVRMQNGSINSIICKTIYQTTALALMYMFLIDRIALTDLTERIVFCGLGVKF